jgi:hypothetical protein
VTAAAMLTAPPAVGKFTWERVLSRLDIPATTKAVARALQRYADKDGTKARPGIAQLAKDLSLSERCVLSHLRRLRALGLIWRKVRGARALSPWWNDDYILTIPPDLQERVERFHATTHARTTRTCSRLGCGKPHHAAGCCRRHYDQSRARRCTAIPAPAKTSAKQTAGGPAHGQSAGDHRNLMREKPASTCGNTAHQPCCSSTKRPGPLDGAWRWRARRAAGGPVWARNHETIVWEMRIAARRAWGDGHEEELTDDDLRRLFDAFRPWGGVRDIVRYFAGPRGIFRDSSPATLMHKAIQREEDRIVDWAYCGRCEGFLLVQKSGMCSECERGIVVATPHCPGCGKEFTQHRPPQLSGQCAGCDAKRLPQAA